MSLRGDVTLAGDKIAIEDLKAEFDRKPVTGRFAYFFPSGKRPARLDAELKAPQFDIDAALDFGKALLAGSAVGAAARDEPRSRYRPCHVRWHRST